MSIAAMNWAWEQPLKPADMLTLIALADWADEDGYCYPGIKRLLERVHVSRRTMIETLKRLEEGGFFTRERRTTESGKRTSNGYWLALDGPSADSAPSPGSVQIEAPYVQTVAPTKEPSVEPSVTTHKAKRPTSLPMGWHHKTKHEQIAADRHVDVALEEMKFLAWAEAKGVTYVNWDAAFANWLLRATPTGGFHPRPTSPTPTERMNAVLDIPDPREQRGITDGLR